MRLFDLAADGVCRAVSCALGAALAELWVDGVVEECLTYACRASLLYDVSLILISEVLQSRKNRVRCCLTESAE